MIYIFAVVTVSVVKLSLEWHPASFARGVAVFTKLIGKGCGRAAECAVGTRPGIEAASGVKPATTSAGVIYPITSLAASKKWTGSGAMRVVATPGTVKQQQLK